MDLAADQEKAGAIAIETGSVMTLITENVLNPGTTKGRSSEMIEIGKLPHGSMIVPPVAIALAIKLQGPHA